MTCHESAIIPLYLDGLPQKVKYYQSPSHGLDALKNPLYEFSSFYSIPKVLEEIADDLREGKLNEGDYHHDFNGIQKGTLKLKVRDLISQRFTYTVEVNDELVGILHAKKNKRGRLLNELTFTFPIHNKLKKEGNKITISADDSDRPRPQGLSVVDDILVDSVEVNGLELLATPLHIGDQPEFPDMEEGLGFLRNHDDFSRSSFQKTGEILW